VSLLHKRDYAGATAAQLIPGRPVQRAGAVTVNSETALRHSAVWACLRLRANLVSTMPVDAYRRVGGVQIEVSKPPILTIPGGDRVDIGEWLYSSQFDLDRAGNCFGLIVERTGFGLPARIDLVPVADVTVVVRKGRLDHYRIGQEVYQPSEVWHERQYTMAGLHVGLSPLAYAAWSIGEYLSIQQFALDWFGNGSIPAASLRNNAKTVTQAQAEEIKDRFKAAVAGRDIFVTGMDWEYQMIQAEQAGSGWLEAKDFGIGDVARFFDVPGDVIDAAVRTGGNINYANVVERNLQLLILHLGPTVVRRENALTRLLPVPRYVKLNTDSLLRMDPKARAEQFALQIDSRTLAPSEARAKEDRPPFTESQLAEFDRLFGAPRTNPQPASAPVTVGGQ
jgi:HK97 family phage portal protein